MWLCDGEIDCLNIDNNNMTMVSLFSSIKVEDEDQSLCGKMNYFNSNHW